MRLRIVKWKFNKPTRKKRKSPRKIKISHGKYISFFLFPFENANLLEALLMLIVWLKVEKYRNPARANLYSPSSPSLAVIVAVIMAVAVEKITVSPDPQGMTGSGQATAQRQDNLMYTLTLPKYLAEYLSASLYQRNTCCSASQSEARWAEKWCKQV